MARRLPNFRNPILKDFSKYILKVMAHKSDEELQRMEGFANSSDSHTDVMNLLFGLMVL